MRRVRTFYAVARNFGIRAAMRQARLFAGNLGERVGGLLRAPLEIISSTAPSQSNATIRIDPSGVFQPGEDAIEAYAHCDIRDTANIDGRTARRLHHKNIPYAKYMQEWHFHPGRIGGELVSLPLRNEKLPQIAHGVSKCFSALPNGGAALYYPHTFRVTRLQTKEYIYSGIAQAQLLAGYARLARSPALSESDRTHWRDFAERIVRSLEFPFERGGVNMEGKALLETPNFRSPPEIVLNGWLDALIHLHDYIEDFSLSGSLRELFEANIRALADLLAQFDDEHLRLSKYSNLSPYRVGLRLRNRARAVPPISILYRARPVGFHDYRIDDLRALGSGGENFFENKVLYSSGKRIGMLLSSSSLYDVEVRVEADAERLELDSHPYRIWSAASGHPGRALHIAPADDSRAGETVFRFSPSALLMTGQPTDFAKGYNFYHTYHAVALRILAGMTENIEAQATMEFFARKWLDYICSPHPRIRQQRLGFADAQKVFRQIGKYRGRPSNPSFEPLMAERA